MMHPLRMLFSVSRTVIPMCGLDTIWMQDRSIQAFTFCRSLETVAALTCSFSAISAMLVEEPSDRSHPVMERTLSAEDITYPPVPFSLKCIWICPLMSFNSIPIPGILTTGSCENPPSHSSITSKSLRMVRELTDSRLASSPVVMACRD